ncbi:MAG TPA: metallophosphoesterase [Candidatus Methylacidiphilales bacterium]|jgi:predicted MPP superfamily phosphohydrolase|nr:metallophosphoesterase [Candidatus Methylacidiphilales bacterium]
MFIGIALIATYFVAENFGCAALQVWLLRRGGSSARWMEAAVFLWAFLMSGLFLLEAFEPPEWKPFLREWFYFPMAVEMVWNVLLLQVFFPGMILAVILALRLTRDRRCEPAQTGGMSRRRFLYLAGCGAVPATAIGMGVHGALTREELRVREFSIPVAGLPSELEGFTIAHVSDLHSGIFVGPERLKIISDMTNDLKADMVAITGDIINREMDEFPAALAAIQRIESPYGTYLCEGNHDAIPGSCVLVAECERNGLAMLFNTCRAIPVRGGRLVLGGLSWTRYFHMNTQPGMVGDLFPPRREGDARILLAHHPHLFDIAQEADVVLSGHTHGGQIMFGDIGLGRLRFRYWSGLYQRGGTTMIVSNGCGDWFPCRIGAPAEIGVVRLTKA